MEICIEVKTKKSTTTYLNNGSVGDTVNLGTGKDDKAIESQIKDARNERSQNYINPVGKFDAQIRKDENGVISGIVY